MRILEHAEEKLPRALMRRLHADLVKIEMRVEKSKGKMGKPGKAEGASL
jgi:hypothetical protein